MPLCADQLPLRSLVRPADAGTSFDLTILTLPLELVLVISAIRPTAYVVGIKVRSVVLRVKLYLEATRGRSHILSIRGYYHHDSAGAGRQWLNVCPRLKRIRASSAASRAN